jgi:hypothetical protein
MHCRRQCRSRSTNAEYVPSCTAAGSAEHVVQKLNIPPHASRCTKADIRGMGSWCMTWTVLATFALIICTLSWPFGVLFERFRNFISELRFFSSRLSFLNADLDQYQDLQGDWETLSYIPHHTHHSILYHTIPYHRYHL